MLKKEKYRFKFVKKSQFNLLLVSSLLAILIILSLSSASAQYSRTSPAYTQSSEFIQFSGQQGFPLFDRNLCEAGQDFILQVSPLGCIPSVVRSDLLEDQNVPVLCPITATQINPLIDIEAVNNINFRFEGPAPPEVQGLTYVPARAALADPRIQVNQPVFNNLGYAVIVLKRQPDETAMPDFVQGNLTARIRYDIKNAFGVGKAVYSLPELAEAEWENNFRRYGFWQGRGYLRAESIGDDNAIISIYSDREATGFGVSGEKRKLATVQLNVGEKSENIPMPGFNFCLGSMQLELKDLESPNTRAKLTVNGDVFELKEGEKFIDNRCEIKNIEKQGVNQKVSISCQTDDGRKNFPLSISPKVILNINGESKEYGVGNRLYEADSEKSVYLIYVGTTGISTAENSLFVGLAAVPGHKENLTSEELNSLAGFIERQPSEVKRNLGSVTVEGFKFFASLTERALRDTISGQGFRNVNFGETKEIFGSNVRIDGYGGPQNFALTGDAKTSYDRATEDYQEVVESFSQDVYPPIDQRTLGERALFSQIEIAFATEQKRTVAELCEEFREFYPNSFAPGVCDDAVRLSSSGISVQDVFIAGRTYIISFDDVREPSSKEFGATISVNGPGIARDFNLRKNQIVYINDETGEFIQLLDLTQDSARLRISLNPAGTREAAKQFLTTDTKTLERGLPETFRSTYTFSLQQVNLTKLAKVSVIPNIHHEETEATFGFRIGIEKRGIQLTPEQTREKIDSLNATLEKLRGINDRLGNVVSGFKAACLGVGTTLTIKNFFSNLEGKGIARNQVMRGPGGWFEICEDAANRGEYGGSIDKCLLDNNPAIETAVNERAQIIDSQNDEFERLQRLNKISDGFLGEDVIDTSGMMKDYLPSVKNELNSRLSDAGIQTINVQGVGVPVSSIIGNMTPDNTLLSQAKNLQLNARILGGSQDAIARSAIEKDLTDIWINSRRDVERQNVENRYGIPAVLGSTKELKEFPITSVETFGNARAKNEFKGAFNINDNAFVVIWKDRSDGREYLLVLDDDYVIRQTYLIGANNVLSLHEPEKQPNPLGLASKYFDRSTYQNQYQKPQVRYFETGQYKGLPAIVPFDVQNGWYAATKTTLPVGGNIKAFDDSGRVSSFWLCNVGSNGREEFNSGIGDDVCQMINIGTGQPYNQFPGLEPAEATKLVTQARNAIADASRGHSAGIRNVRVLGQRIEVGEPAVGIPDIQCQDFMSPSDCNLLFNVCDPVVCPSSRCDLGGTYPVADVVQSGVVGGLLLCLPNFPEVKVPICLSGVHAGLQGYLSVLDSYQQCLQTSLETGQTVGVCDELHSVYMCEFFWRQGLPLARVAVPQVIGKVLGQDVRGGGEYLGVQDAWQNAENSVNFFTQYYAADSFRAFKARTAEGVGTEICRNWVSVTAPDGGNLLDALTAPDVPAQFYGRFDEIPFTTATNPPISHYKVFYHIYAGEDFPAQFQVYLRGTGSSFFQDTGSRRIVAQGFIARGEYATETRDFTAPSGYQEMCIVVNNREECGFKQVTTDFGINFITEQYVADEASRTDIASEAACVSGTPNLMSIVNPTLNPNIQAGAEEFVDPAIYNRGITRICATDNPGSATNPERWTRVGHCGNANVGCWLDRKSVEKTIRSTDIEAQVIDDTAGDYLETLRREGGFMSTAEFDDLVQDVNSEQNPEGKVSLINEKFDRIFYNHEKGFATLLRANAYAELARKFFQEIKDRIPSETQSERERQETTGEVTSCEDCGTALGGFFCDEAECSEISRTTGKNCVFEDRTWPIPNTCTEGTGTTPAASLSCSNRESCQKVLGNEIIKIAREIKQQRGVTDSTVRQDTGASSFECLALMVSLTESSIQHCSQHQQNQNPLYCDGNLNEIISGDEFQSSGIMQINRQAHPNVDVADFKTNVNYAINLLVDGHSSTPRTYVCNGRTYSGWTRALRQYNGWPATDNIDCTKGNPRYVEDVLSTQNRNTVANLFPQVCGSQAGTGSSPGQAEEGGVTGN